MPGIAGADAAGLAADGGSGYPAGCIRADRTDPPAERVQQVTFVPFLPGGRCVLIERAEGPGLPDGEVLDGEGYLIDTVLRVPLQAGVAHSRTALAAQPS